MLYRSLIIAILVVWMTGLFAQTDTTRRIALVIGNSDYQSSPLKNPVNDARAMEITLQELGFETTAAYDVKSLREFLGYIQSFGEQIRTGGVGLFYYAGHGVQVDGKNYLIPTQARIRRESDVEFEGVDLDRVLTEMQNADNELNIILLDACRDNPYATGFRSGTRGLASITRPVPDCLIAYATQPNGVAADGDGNNGVFTEELLKSITTPGLSLTQIMMRVREGVKNRTANLQLPWETSLLTKDFYFIPDNTDFNRERLQTALDLNLGGKSGTSYRAQSWVALTLVTLDVCAALYFNSRSNSYYDKYQAATDPETAVKYRDKTENYDTYTGICTYTVPLPLSWLVYTWVKDSNRNSNSQRGKR
ncbi:MAG: caspase family protein [Candidatus Cloacimonetes bacterium]|nr:caspase family protein [Candidatus Cloacimonadota bacterium]